MRAGGQKLRLACSQAIFLQQQFPGIESLDFANADIVSELSIPRIQSLEVVNA